ncbi:MAG TPA: DUF1441 family protein [Pyrinomonadaceae bacterium]|nr:DUF1441 family protein [Pyrinomonadaceae bacterium]
MKAGDTSLSISQLAKLCGLDRATVTKRLEAVPSAPGEKGAKLYLLSEALPALIAGESSEMDDAKLRKTQAEADLKELEYRREQNEVVEVKEVADYALRLFKAINNRVAVRFPREIAAQVYKAESPAHATEILQRELGRLFNELREDHKRFL